MKRKVKWLLDILMTIALLLLMGYHFWGEKNHEWFGAAMCVLFIAHQICNLSWYKSLTKGKYTPVRILWLIINILTLAAMLALMYSGIIMSRYVFAFLPIKGGLALARQLHLLGSYWGFLLMSLHFGLHWGMIWNLAAAKIFKRNPAQKSKTGKIACFIAGFLIVAYGVYVFIKRDFLTYMLLRTHFVFFDYEESKPVFLLEYLALMGLCIFIAHYGAELLKKINDKGVKKNEISK